MQSEGFAPKHVFPALRPASPVDAGFAADQNLDRNTGHSVDRDCSANVPAFKVPAEGRALRATVVMTDVLAGIPTAPLFR